MSEEKTIRFGYSSSSNISFQGTVHTEITRSQWDEMSKTEQADTMDEVVYELVDLYVLADDEEDVH